jgi:hypothetical protein
LVSGEDVADAAISLKPLRNASPGEAQHSPKPRASQPLR